MREDPAALRYWLGTLGAWKRWFRYTVEGLENLAVPECRLVVGYHGRPTAYDLFLLGGEVHARHGYLPLALVHRFFNDNLFLRWLTEGLDWATGKGPVMAESVARGRHMILAPGGSHEGLRPGWIRYRVDWGHHVGYLRYAIKNRLKIVPVGTSGVDDTYFGLNHGDDLRRRLRLPEHAFVWVGVSAFGVHPAPPNPVRMHTVVGEAIDPLADGPVELGDRDRLEALHRVVQGRVQSLMDQARVAVRDGTAPRVQRLSLRQLLDRSVEAWV